MNSAEWLLIKGVIERGCIGCQVAALGDIDELTHRKVRLVLGAVQVESLGEIEGLPGRQVLCSTCNQGAKNIPEEKPTSIWLLSQVRRAGQDEQRAVFNWLSKKFG
jgi:hypothetical protein